jgi:hypothetical protein
MSKKTLLMDKLRPVAILWYIFTLFVLALVAESAVSVAPGGEAMQTILMGTWAALAVLFAVLASTLKRLGVSQTKWLVRVLLGVAVLATAAVALIAVG